MFNEILDKDLIDNLLNRDNKEEIVENGSGGICQYNLTKDDDSNDYFIAWDSFKAKPNKITVFSQFNTDLLWNSIRENFEILESDINKISEVIPEDEHFIYNTKYFIRLCSDLYITFLEFDSTDEESGDVFCTNLILYYNPKRVDTNDVNNYLTLFQSAILNVDSGDDSNLSILRISLNNEFELFPMEHILDVDDDNIEMYYEFDVYKETKMMAKSINKSSKGLTVLYGDRGLGKTHFVSNLMHKLKKRVIYIPANLIEHTITNIDFVAFLKRYPNSVLIMDDGEPYFNKMHQRANVLVNGLLQLTDSIVSNSINTNIIVTINLERGAIDDNIFKCNNLLNHLEFNQLGKKKSKELKKFLKKKNKSEPKSSDSGFGY